MQMSSVRSTMWSVSNKNVNQACCDLSLYFVNSFTTIEISS